LVKVDPHSSVIVPWFSTSPELVTDPKLSMLAPEALLMVPWDGRADADCSHVQGAARRDHDRAGVVEVPSGVNNPELVMVWPPLLLIVPESCQRRRRPT
jgi:hypothetical protein